MTNLCFITLTVAMFLQSVGAPIARSSAEPGLPPSSAHRIGLGLPPSSDAVSRSLRNDDLLNHVCIIEGVGVAVEI
jgi:hypothetical protein